MNNWPQVPNDRVGEQIDANLAIDQDQLNRTSENLQPNIPVNNSFMVLNVEETNTVNNEPSISVYTLNSNVLFKRKTCLLASKMSVN